MQHLLNGRTKLSKAKEFINYIKLRRYTENKNVKMKKKQKNRVCFQTVDTQEVRL